MEDSRKNLAFAGSAQPVTWQNWAILASMAAGLVLARAVGFEICDDPTLTCQSQSSRSTSQHTKILTRPVAVVLPAPRKDGSPRDAVRARRPDRRGRVLVLAVGVVAALRAQTPRTRAPAPARAARRKSPHPSSRRGRALRVTTRAASICGIDLGTTNSAVAIVVDGKPVIVADAKGNRTIPSVVSFAADGSVLVGHDARRRLAKDPANTFSSVKRFIGKRFDSKTVKDDAQRVPYEVVAAPDGGVALRCPALGADVTPVDVSRHILATLLATAEDGAGVKRGDIKRAVVTVPAYFDDAQCAATIEAGKRAGLEKVKLLHEPVAAALAYGVDVEADETVFVFDLGGGTFDVSVLDVGGGTVEVLATGGDAHLGGDDLDRALAVWLAKEAKSLNAEVDPRGALMAARRARERLSEAMEVAIPMPGGAVKTLTRPLLEKVCARVLRSMRLPVEIAADSAGINLEALQAAATKGGKGIKNKRTLARRGVGPSTTSCSSAGRPRPRRCAGSWRTRSGGSRGRGWSTPTRSWRSARRCTRDPSRVYSPRRRRWARCRRR